MMEPGGRRQELSRPRGLRIGTTIQHLVAARRALGDARRELFPLELREAVALLSQLEDQVHGLTERLIAGDES